MITDFRLMSVRETPLPSKSKNFLLLRLDILRDCLSKELTLEPPYFPFELKRAIDDWVRRMTSSGIFY